MVGLKVFSESTTLLYYAAVSPLSIFFDAMLDFKQHQEYLLSVHLFPPCTDTQGEKCFGPIFLGLAPFLVDI